MSNNNLKTIQKIESKTKIYLVIIAIILIVLCINNTNYIIPSVIAYAVIIFYTMWTYNKRKGELSSYIDDLTFTVDSAAKNTLINSPFPLIILETNGNVIWRSSSFNKEFANIGINAYIDDLSREIELELKNSSVNIDKTLQIHDKTYHVMGDYIKIRKKDRRRETQYMVILYFIDKTKEFELETKYTNSKTCIGIIMIDNYEEIIQRLTEDNKPQLTAKIDKLLYDWASETRAD